MNDLIDNLPRRDPDPTGDVVLTIGREDNQKRIKVSSSILSLVSPVFKAMFSSPFVEGRASSSENPKEVDLPDDDANAMVWLCHGLHCVDLSTEAKVPIRILEHLALLVDKYDCVGAISAWGHIWLRQWSDFEEETGHDSPISADRYWDLLSVALVFDDQRAFYQFSKYIIYHYMDLGPLRWGDDDEASALAGTTVGELPDFVKGTSNLECYSSGANFFAADICARREAAYNSICDGLEEIVAPALAMDPETCLDARGASIPINTCRRSAKVLHFFHYLTSWRIWPRSELQLHGKSVEKVLTELEAFENWHFYGEQRPKSSRFYDKSKCRCVREDYRKKIESIVWRERADEGGLCLACVKLRKACGSTGEVNTNCGSKTLTEHRASLQWRD